MIVFDTYAWIEYFIGSEKGRIAKKYVDSDEEIGISSLCLAEIKVKYEKEGRDPSEKIKFILSRSRIIAVNAEIALLAAEQKVKQGLYLIDAVMYATAINSNAKLLSGDKHFQKLDRVELLK